MTHLHVAVQEDASILAQMFPPLGDKHIPMGDVFTSCNWVMRDGCGFLYWGSCNQVQYAFARAPKTATKRVFLITDEDDPHPGLRNERLLTSARTTLIVSGITNIQYPQYPNALILTAGV